MQIRKLKTIDVFIFSVVCSLFAYVVSRAILVDITHDEAYSFYNVKHFWYVEALCTGNTHWINSLAMKSAVMLGFETLGAIRWLSILSAFIFFSIVFIWVYLEKELYIKLFILAIFLFNPYILDYFSLARGYAPGLALQTVGLFLFFQSFYTTKNYFLFLSLFFSGLSALANFSFIYFFMAFCIVYFYKRYFKLGFPFLKSKYFYRDFTYSIVIAVLVIRAFIFMTTCSNDVVGAGTPFFSEYFHVFVDGLIYLKFDTTANTLTLLSYVIFTITCMSSLYGIIWYKTHKNLMYFYTSIILAIILSVTLINCFCFNVVFPYYRSAIFLFPTTAICFVYFVSMGIRNEIIKKIGIYFISILLSLNFIFGINFKYGLDFHLNANLKDSFDYVATLHPKKVGISPELYGGFRNYYQMKSKNRYSFIGESINTNLPKGICANKNKLKEFEYIILFPPYNLSYYINNSISFKVDKLFPETGTVVLRIL
ncbi:MAG: hypothetical protein SFY56_04900 [Bacteroidota bacterium]|nr:hypothetical protein [Bacteroidota bacterium]